MSARWAIRNVRRSNAGDLLSIVLPLVSSGFTRPAARPYTHVRGVRAWNDPAAHGHPGIRMPHVELSAVAGGYRWRQKPHAALTRPAEYSRESVGGMRWFDEIQ